MKTKYAIILLCAALMLPLSWASGAVSLQFNNSLNNQVGGSPATLSGAPGGTVTVSLQLVSTAEGTTALDYWLSQFSGPTAGAFSIINRDYTGSIYPDPSASNAQVTSSTDTFSNSTGGPGSDSVPDNVINPQNGFDLGSSKSDTTVNQGPGTWQVATFTLQISNTAALGTYQLRSFDYSGFGWSSTTVQDQSFSAQAAINVDVTAVPEPATWSLMMLGGFGTFGLTLLRARRKS